jgi:hypothetical protein
MMPSVLRYRRRGGGPVSEHVASVESLIQMGSSLLIYRRGGGAIE